MPGEIISSRIGGIVMIKENSHKGCAIPMPPSPSFLSIAAAISGLSRAHLSQAGEKT
jgi:hypothetical protein